jgi:hypothetical protein
LLRLSEFQRDQGVSAVSCQVFYVQLRLRSGVVKPALIRGEVAEGATWKKDRKLWDKVSIAKCFYAGIFENLELVVVGKCGRIEASKVAGAS